LQVVDAAVEGAVVVGAVAAGAEEEEPAEAFWTPP
jgi:hypothetical protein